MRVLILTSLLVAGTAGFVQAGADVKVKDGLVSIRAASAPLAEVLESLQEQTGMKVIYDGPRPQQAIGVTIEDQTLTAAISTLLDAQGIKYAVALNSAGTKVATLLITTSSAPKAPAHPVTEAPPPQYEGDENAYTMPPMPPMSPPGMEAPPPTMPATAAPTTITGPGVSPFTPQGPGPILIPPPSAAAAPASGSATVGTPPPPTTMPAAPQQQPPPVMTPLPGPSTAERPPWEK